MKVTGDDVQADVVRPSALGPSELAAWRRMQEECVSLQRAFFSPSFALACERAHGRAYVAVLHQHGTIHGFFPFQFPSVWHERLRLAERIGGGLSDAAGVIGDVGLSISAASLLRRAGLGLVRLNHMLGGQEQFGLEADWSEVSYVTDLRDGPARYFADLQERNRDFVRDTERRRRRAQKAYGAVTLRNVHPITETAIGDLIEVKRRQYSRTQVQDAFAAEQNRHLINMLNSCAAAECQLVLATLGNEERSLAQHLGLRYHGVLSWWFPVYDPDAQAVSPGRLLLWDIISNAGEAAIHLIDYGAGEAQYKRQFSTGTIPIGRALWSAHNVRSLLARGWQSIEWRMRARATVPAARQAEARQ